MPGQGVVSMFSMGYGYGLLLGVIVALEIPYTLVAPQTWKKAMLFDMPARDKAASLARAKQLFPTMSGEIGKHHGKAEALLIAEYGKRLLLGQKGL